MQPSVRIRNDIPECALFAERGIGGKDMNNFKKVGSDYECFPTFIPPYVLDNMAQAGIEEAKSTILQSQAFRENRIKTAKKMGLETAFGAVVPAGRAYVQVYDCETTTTRQNKIVRDQEKSPGPTGDTAVDNAYDYVSSDRDFLNDKEIIRRNCLDNNGMDIICNVHYGVKYNNAFWDGEQINFGDGDEIRFTNFAKSLDVIGHELGHGVVQYTANFEYHDQPGALHEHYADVFGTVVSQWFENQATGKEVNWEEIAHSADWLIGDEIMGPDLYGEALRSMSEPGTAYDNNILGKDPQPDHMKDIYSGSGDLGGVHINSGIMNKAFYLTAIEIGTDQAALIWYNALQHLWPTAIFKDAVIEIVKAARILAKNNKVHKNATQRVRTAFREVGLF
ncbi:MAG: M4 family metallopeptidase [Deltaproteobacteria bacterium]